jgi:hypothetical protein
MVKQPQLFLSIKTANQSYKKDIKSTPVNIMLKLTKESLDKLSNIKFESHFCKDIGNSQFRTSHININKVYRKYSFNYEEEDEEEDEEE